MGYLARKRRENLLTKGKSLNLVTIGQLNKMKKHNLLHRIIFSKCPNCGDGDMFPYGIYKIQKMGKMNSNCSKCNQTFNPEPVFYTGAMYVSYAFSVGIMFSFYFGNLILGSPLSVNEIMLLITMVIIVFAPVSYRWSRSIWAQLFIPTKDKK